jgi:hypothetical protein
MELRGLLVLTSVAVTAGCGSQMTASRSTSASARRAESYRLYTHCGIEWAEIEGTFWRASRPLSDGNGNPPAGWGNPFQEGKLAFRGHATAEFSSPVVSITFKRTDRARPPVLCS